MKKILSISALFPALAAQAMFDARSSASFNPTLTTFASGIAQGMDISDATFLAPIVRAGANTGKYKRFDLKEQIVIYETARALGQLPNEINRNAVDVSFDCKPQALMTTVDDEEREDDSSSLDESRIQGVISSSYRSLLYRVMAKLRAGKAAHATYGGWYDPAVNPIGELNQAIVDLAMACGLMPNKLWIDLGMWNVLTQHPAVQDKVAGIEIGASVAAIKKMLTNNPAIEIKVGTTIYDSGNPGANSAAGKFIGGGTAFLFRSETSPSMEDPSFAKIITKNGNLLGDVRTWRKEPVADCHGVFWSEDIQVTAPVTGLRIDLKGAPALNT